MKKIYIILLLIIFSTDAYSQIADSVLKKGWNTKGVLGLGLSQVALTNWSKGGESTLSMTGFSDFDAVYLSLPWISKNSLKLSLGTTKTGGGSFQTNDNQARLENMLIRKIKWAVDPYVSNEIRTGILNGYDYSKDPKVPLSKFFDPGYITQSIGMTYVKPNFLTRLGLAFQETFTDEFNQYSDDPDTKDEIENFKFQTGIESVTETNLTIAHNLLYTGRLRLFSAFETMDVWDVDFDNTISAKVNDFLSVNLNVLVIYEKSQSPKTQLKEGLNIGLNYTVF
ncbi:MAG: hypothetical protein HGGPFJEG_02786 [Ignavibacteria bacterium]|nr:hypothetical protein [Ignavibacteria bacterium]